MPWFYRLSADLLQETPRPGPAYVCSVLQSVVQLDLDLDPDGSWIRVMCAYLERYSQELHVRVCALGGCGGACLAAAMADESCAWSYDE